MWLSGKALDRGKRLHQGKGICRITMLLPKTLFFTEIAFILSIKLILLPKSMFFTELPQASITGYSQPIKVTESFTLDCNLHRPMDNIRYKWTFYPDVAGLKKHHTTVYDHRDPPIVSCGGARSTSACARPGQKQCFHPSTPLRKKMRAGGGRIGREGTGS